jgi:hypothetical protein
MSKRAKKPGREEDEFASQEGCYFFNNYIIIARKY